MMKKILLLLSIVLSFSIAGMSQSMELSVSGTVYDLSGNSLVPVPGQEVTISIDSTVSGFSYENTVLTDSAGFFSDLIDLSGMQTMMGLVHIYTFDPCLGFNQEQIFPLIPGIPPVITEFYLCDTVVDPCQAAFYYYPADSMGMMTGMYQFVDISFGNPTSWLWDFGDGTQSTEQNPVHEFTDNGIFPVCLTITDSINNCTSVYCEDVFVMPGPGGCHNFFHFYPTGQENEYTFEGFLMCGDTALSYDWDFGDGTTGTGQTVTHQFPSDSTEVYTVCLTTSVLQANGDTCTSVSCKDVPLLPPPFPCSSFFTFEKTDTLTFTFTGEAFMGGMVATNFSEFYWDFGDGTTDTGHVVTHTFPADSVFFYHVCLTTYTVDPQTGDTCNSHFCHMVHVDPWPGPGCASNFMHYPGPGLEVNFEGFTMSPFPTEYNWEFGDGTTGTGQIITHVYDSAGHYPVTLTTTDSTGCSWTTVKPVMVGPPPPFDIFGTVYLDSALTADEGIVRLVKTDSLWQSVVIIDSVEIQADGSYLFEDVPTGFFPHYYTQAELGPGSAYFGDYLPTYHISALSWENAFPIMPFMNWPADIFMIAGNTVASGPGTITGSVNSLGAREAMEGIHVMLMSEDHSPYHYVTTGTDGTYEFNDIALGTYIVHAEVMGVHNTEATVTLDEENQQAGINFIVDGNQAFLSVEEPGFINLGSVGEVFPNPVTEQASININMKERADVTISVHDITGNAIWTVNETLSTGENLRQVETRELARGIYFLRVTTENGEQITRKLVKVD